MPHLGFAVMLAKGLRWKHELAQGRQVFHLLVGFIEGVDRKPPVDGHRLSPLLVTEHDPTTESSLGRFALSVTNRIGPGVGHQDGDSWLRRFVAPGEFVGQIELRTAGKHSQDEQTPGPKE